MTNPRLAQRYAKSLLDLAKEIDQFDAVHDDIILLDSVCSRATILLSCLKALLSPQIKNIR